MLLVIPPTANNGIRLVTSERTTRFSAVVGKISFEIETEEGKKGGKRRAERVLGTFVASRQPSARRLFLAKSGESRSAQMPTRALRQTR